jgi:methionine-rich copper-binding protein CopC
MRILSCSLLAALLLSPTLASAQLSVVASTPKIVGQKAVVTLAFKNNFAEKIESARAAVFLLDEHGKMVAQSSKWVIGGEESKPGLGAGATNVFNFVVTADKPFTSTNLVSKVNFSRVVFEGGRIADVTKTVTMTPANK